MYDADLNLPNWSPKAVCNIIRPSEENFLIYVGQCNPRETCIGRGVGGHLKSWKHYESMGGRCILINTIFNVRKTLNQGGGAINGESLCASKKQFPREC